MKQVAHALIGAIVGTAMISGTPASSGEPPAELQLDAVTTIAGVEVACTGIGQTKNDPRWLGYPVRLEFANTQHEYLVGVTVRLSASQGASLFEVSCAGPWLLLKLPDRAPYRVEAHMSDAIAPVLSRVVIAPKTGQTRVVLTFPDS